MTRKAAVGLAAAVLAEGIAMTPGSVALRTMVSALVPVAAMRPRVPSFSNRI